DEAVVVLGVVESRAKAPAGELSDGKLVFLTGFGDAGDGAVLALPRPQLDGAEAELGRALEALHERHAAKPHLDVDGEARVCRAAKARHVAAGGRPPGRQRRRADEPAAGRQELSPTAVHGALRVRL